MTLDKAIEILTLMGKPEFDGHTEDILAVRRLSIEAIKRHKHQQENLPWWGRKPLPGETKD